MPARATHTDSGVPTQRPSWPRAHRRGQQDAELAQLQAVPDAPTSNSTFCVGGGDQQGWFNWRMWQHYLVQSPMYVWAMLTMWFVSLRLVLFGRRVTDADVIRLTTETSCSVLVHATDKVDQETGDPVWRFEYRGCRMVLFDGTHTRDLVFEFTRGEQPRLCYPATFVSQAGKHQLNSADAVMGALFPMFVGGIHPHSHVMAERSTVEIKHRGIHQLAESERTIITLHRTLLHSTASPASAQAVGLYAAMTAQSVIDEGSNMPSVRHAFFDGKDAREISHYLKFAFKAHSVCSRVLRKHKLNVELEPFFNGVIIHGADHWATWDMLKDVQLSSTPFSYSSWHVFRAMLFRYMFVRPIVNPVWNNKLYRFPKGSVYRDIYDALEPHYPAYAAQLTASVMY